MSDNLPATVRLNNHLQSLQQVHSISYADVDSGQASQNRWTVTVKINGEEMGSCSAPRMAMAKEAAAQQALDRLGIQ